MTRSGFWEDLDELKEEHSDTDWSFLQNEEKFHGMTPYDFLHGACVVFAQYLNETYGYDVEIAYQRDDDEEDSPAHIVHAYCTAKDSDGDDVYIDVRGANSDWDEFMAEFYDTGLWQNDDYSFEQPYANGVPMDLRIDFNTNKEALKAAESIDKIYKTYNIEKDTEIEYY